MLCQLMEILAFFGIDQLVGENRREVLPVVVFVCFIICNRMTAHCLKGIKGVVHLTL